MNEIFVYMPINIAIVEYIKELKKKKVVINLRCSGENAGVSKAVVAILNYFCDMMCKEPPPQPMK